jgi:hypothetical protein
MLASNQNMVKRWMTVPRTCTCSLAEVTKKSLGLVRYFVPEGLVLHYGELANADGVRQRGIADGLAVLLYTSIMILLRSERVLSGYLADMMSQMIYQFWLTSKRIRRSVLLSP